MAQAEVRQNARLPRATWSARAWLRLLAGTALLLGGPWLLPFAARPTLEIVRPEPGERVGIDGVELLLRFREDADPRITPPSFRVLLNGADVTRELTTGENGASGRITGLLDGENVIRVEVLGRPLWPAGLLTPERREVRVLVRRPLDFDQG